MPQRPPALPPAATDSWFALAHTIDPAITADPGWPALAHALQRAETGGYPARDQLAALAAEALPDDNPARALHYRLVDATESAAATEPHQPIEQPASTTPAAAQTMPGTTPRQAPGPAR